MYVRNQKRQFLIKLIPRFRIEHHSIRSCSGQTFLEQKTVMKKGIGSVEYDQFCTCNMMFRQFLMDKPEFPVFGPISLRINFKDVGLVVR